ncbi:hypothetical protein DR950_17930 [Kitasatospora xanthocidica]|uniref:Uncharacterized protein n=1 Tax=Kitasatospora xanthocidica TaxID=83382 RepID=A0A372ZU60_9ACTN|nr:hypothetical protein [Kitasatospora xanthocidica]RGD59423.1 hypothetical protein DR950_17930 [Kitasatospora xanthocidica]
MVDAKWRGIDLARAYLTRDRVRVAACLEGLDTERLECVLGLLAFSYDDLLGDLGEPFMKVSDLDKVAAVAPLETELATTTAVHRVAAKEVGFAQAMTDLGLVDRIHALSICSVVMLLGAFGHAGAVAHLDEEAATCERMGYLRPYTLT